MRKQLEHLRQFVGGNAGTVILDRDDHFVAVTDERGIYRIPARVGGYDLAAELQGFTTAQRTSVELLVGQTLVVNLSKAPSGVAVRCRTFGECIDAVRALKVSWGPGSADDEGEPGIEAALKKAELPFVNTPLAGQDKVECGIHVVENGDVGSTSGSGSGGVNR